MKPSRPGALEEPRLDKALNTSSYERIEQRNMFSFSMMIEVNKSNISSSVGREEEENRLEKWKTKLSAILALSETQFLSLIFKKFIAFNLLLIRVEAWKYLVLRSLQVNQVSLNLDFQRISFFYRRSSRSSFSFASRASKGGIRRILLNLINLAQSSFDIGINVAKMKRVPFLQNNLGLFLTS